MRKPTIAVLMSVYNGRKYIKEQVDSIFNQTLKPTHLYIRADGEADSSREAIIDYLDRDDVTYENGEHLGVSKSFLNLLCKVRDYDYYAFSDQDDVWLPEKLNMAVEKIKEVDDGRPVLYISSFTPVDEQLNRLPCKIPFLYSYTDFAHSLIYHTGPGCSFVMNNAAKEIVSSIDFEGCFIGLHDSLIHKIIAMCGKVVYDENSYILYRQHDSNAIGYETNRLKSFIKRLIGFNNGRLKNYRKKMAQTLLGCCNGLYDEKQAALLRKLAYYDSSFANKIALIRTPEFKTHSYYDLLFDALVLLGKV